MSGAWEGWFSKNPDNQLLKAALEEWFSWNPDHQLMSAALKGWFGINHAGSPVDVSCFVMKHKSRSSANVCRWFNRNPGQQLMADTLEEWFSRNPDNQLKSAAFKGWLSRNADCLLVWECSAVLLSDKLLWIKAILSLCKI
jgi:hypothetical protein